jgi:hypothetical protein
MICAEDTRNELPDTGVDIPSKASVIALSRCDEDGNKSPSSKKADPPSTSEEESPKKKQKTSPFKESPTVSDSEADEQVDPTPSNNSEEAITSSQHTDKDVLSGRGGGTNLHPGNRYYRDLIFNHRETYDVATKANKPNVSRKIVMMIRESGGRFLRRDGKGLYHEIGDTAAREKTSQALRHRTFEMRNSSAAEQGKGDKKSAYSKKKSREDADAKLAQAKKKLDGILEKGGAAESCLLASGPEAGWAAAGVPSSDVHPKASTHASTSLREKAYIESTMRMQMMEFEMFQQARAESEFKNSLHGHHQMASITRAREHAMAREAHQIRVLQQDSRLRNDASTEMNQALILLRRREAVVAEEAEIALQMGASSAALVRTMPMLDPRRVAAAARFAGSKPNIFYQF